MTSPGVASRCSDIQCIRFLWLQDFVPMHPPTTVPPSECSCETQNEGPHVIFHLEKEALWRENKAGSRQDCASSQSISSSIYSLGQTAFPGALMSTFLRSWEPRNLLSHFKLDSISISENQNHHVMVAEQMMRLKWLLSKQLGRMKFRLYLEAHIFVFTTILWSCVVDTGMRQNICYKVIEFPSAFF